MPDQSPGNSITLFIFTYYEGCVPRRVQMVPDLSAAHTGIEYARPGGGTTVHCPVVSGLLDGGGWTAMSRLRSGFDHLEHNSKLLNI